MLQSPSQKQRLSRQPLLVAIYIGVVLFVLLMGGMGLWLAWQGANLAIGLLLALMLLVSLVGLGLGYRMLDSRLLQPLLAIQEWAQQLRSGHLDTRLKSVSPGDFSNLNTDINQISQRLQLLAEDMQNQVQIQTQFIAQKTRSLEIIYDVAASINVSRDLDDLLTRFLHTLKDVVNARAAVVRLVTEDNQMRLVASTGLDEEVISREQLLPAATCLCGSAYDKGTVQYQPDIRQCDKIIGHSFFNDDNVGMIAVPLQYRDRTLGVYNLFVDKSMMAYAEEINDLLTSIGRHLGMAIDKARLDDETIDKRGLVPGVQYLVNRFRDQTGIHIFLQQEWNIVQLPASFEVEVLRIIQEALNNIRKHSQAQNVRILLRAKPQGDCHILIEDDGVGIDARKSNDKKRDHYGLNIMAERTKRINGDLKIESEPSEGTRVILTFNYANATQSVTPTGTDSVRVTLPNRRVEL
jgi:nitrate/nitrite-specific signal transduction histidine kinase